MGRVTFINHATVLIELDEVSILTDPIYSRSISFFLPRLQKPGIPFSALPPIDIVAISHDHFDHLNLRTMRKVSRFHNPQLIVPIGLGPYGSRTGYRNILEMRVGERTEIKGTRVTCVPAKHISGRGIFDRNKTPAVGYVFETRTGSVYFAGDTAYGDFFTELGKNYSLDVALLPIGAYKPHAWFKGIHLNPQTALQAFIDTGARYLIPIHWGTFKISDESMAEPPEWLVREARAMGIAEQVKVLRNGEGIEF